MAFSLDPNLIDQMNTLLQIEDQVHGRMNSIAFKIFKKLTFDVENADITTLPETISDTLNSEFLTSSFDFWTLLTEKFQKLNKIKIVLGPMANVEGEVTLYFPLTGIGSLKVTGFSQDFFNVFC